MESELKLNISGALYFYTTVYRKERKEVPSLNTGGLGWRLLDEQIRESAEFVCN
jgi:hypothetical protein